MWINFIVAAVAAGTPLLFGTLGEIMNEKSGHLNLGVEGMMALGACAGFMAAYHTSSVTMALLFAFAAGLFGALIYAVLTVSFLANQNVAGLSLTIFGTGLSNFYGERMILNSKTHSIKLPQNVTDTLQPVHIPGLSDLPVVGKLFFSYSPYVYLGILIAILLFVFYKKTQKGLQVTAIGENPAVADAAGINVTKWKYITILIGGGICGLGGAYCSIVTNGGVWMSNSVNGIGWIAVALVIFSAWNPLLAIPGTFVFGALRILKFYIPVSVFRLPDSAYDMLPFLITALILVLGSVRKKREKGMPSFCGRNYYREERT